ncbi:D-aminoacyl-tRNA deacylase [Flavobacteriales bacterium]|jgi:D-tyrosyl-tRNA(Tyr) deacylase|nr:D-aminoacyl-tRNA deacylase [Flavobacteriales bacterium]MDB9910061.1 D-aminoacyl-tRNA deacylase [Flavobacteriales bacterium]
MRAVIQRVEKASVVILENEVAKIEQGLLVLLGIEIEDAQEDTLWLASKIAALRIFSDKKGVMNKSITETGGEVIVVSQFTLHAKTKKGNRPSYIKAARPEQAIALYQQFKEDLTLAIGRQVQSGEFGAEMKVSLINDGPITILIDTKNKE